MAQPICPACSTENPEGARFCMACGTALGGTSAPRALPEERRQVAVLFADLSGYTAVAETMDPEALKSLVDRALRRLGQEVERHGGNVDKYIGDNVMATFGAPVAHEDDAERAVRAALGMQEAMKEVNEALGPRHGVSFDLRVGVNSGEVVAGALGGGYTVIGDAVNVASRLQSAARPGSVIVGERTYRATVDAIEYCALEPLVLKGKADPVPAWEAVSAVAAQPGGRHSPAVRAPLIGRDFELEFLDTLLGRVASEQRAHLVTIVGEAGVGKSRLLQEFEWRLAEEDPPPAVRPGRCLPYGSAVVYWAVGEILRYEVDIVDSDSAEVAWQKLATGIAALLAQHEGRGPESAEREAALIGRLLGIDVPPELAPVEDEDPRRLRESFFAAVRAVVEAMAARQPLVLTFEDLHWADEGMLDLIEDLAQEVRGPLLVMCLTRPELLTRRPSWAAGRHSSTSIGLDPLSVAQTHQLVEALMQGSGSESTALVAARAGGNPLFAEEMVRHLAGDGDAAELPETVQAVLAARLDSLDPFERRILQHAAVSGRTFLVGSLAGFAQEEGGDLEQALAGLVEKDLIMPASDEELAGENEFAFKHLLVRDVAYSMLPKAVRAGRHLEVARYVEERAGDRVDEFVALLADHYWRAAVLGEEARIDERPLQAMQERALRFLEAAGDAAAALYSNDEAFDRYAAATSLRMRLDPAVRARIREKQGDVALVLGTGATSG